MAIQAYCLTSSAGLLIDLRTWTQGHNLDWQFSVCPNSSAVADLLDQPEPLILFVDTRGGDVSPETGDVLEALARRPGKPLTLFTLGERLLPRRVAGLIDLLGVGHLDWPPCGGRPLPSIAILQSAGGRPPARRIPYRFSMVAGDVEIATYEPALKPVLEQVRRIAAHDVTLLLVGETGTGKTTLAQFIHQLSTRVGHPFMHLACGALPKDLIESELFGHARGAFTGADRNKIGRFEAAGRGTLLLDEIDSLGPNEQAKLLKVIETGEYEMVGSAEPRSSQARLIVAANVELETLTQSQRFRSDLYYRLNVLEFRLPPLRDRTLDIVPLALQFVEECCSEYGVAIDVIQTDFLDALRAYGWPGNVRELKNHIRRAVLFCEGGRLTVNDLAHVVMRSQFQPAEVVNNRPADAWTLADRVATSEREILEQALAAHKHKRAATARALGISRVGLYKKMRKHGMLDSAKEESRS